MWHETRCVNPPVGEVGEITAGLCVASDKRRFAVTISSFHSFTSRCVRPPFLQHQTHSWHQPSTPHALVRAASALECFSLNMQSWTGCTELTSTGGGRLQDSGRSTASLPPPGSYRRCHGWWPCRSFGRLAPTSDSSSRHPRTSGAPAVSGFAVETCWDVDDEIEVAPVGQFAHRRWKMCSSLPAVALHAELGLRVGGGNVNLWASITNPNYWVSQPRTAWQHVVVGYVLPQSKWGKLH